MRVSQRPNGFSLIEIMISVILVGLSVTALVLASNSLTRANGAGADLSTAEFLIEEIRELTAITPAAQMMNFDNAVYCPPISADQAVLNDFGAFSQKIIVQKLNPSNLDEVVGDSYVSPFLRVTVTIVQNNKEISTGSWIRAAY